MIAKHCFPGLFLNHRCVSLLASGFALLGAVRSAAAATDDIDILRAALQSRPGIQANGSEGRDSRTAADPRAAGIAERLSSLAGTLNGATPAAVPTRTRMIRSQALERLQQSAGADVEVHFRPENQTIRQIRGRRLEPAASGISLAGEGAVEEKTARNFLRAQRALLLLDDPDRELVLTQRDRDELGHRHLRFAQVHQGIPVWPSGLTVHLDPKGNVHSMDGAYAPSPAQPSLQPGLAAAEATQMARAVLTHGANAIINTPALIIYAPLDQPPRLGWKLEASLDLQHYWQLVVDAANGQILHQSNLCPDAGVAGSGVDLSGASHSLGVWQQGGTNYLVDTSKPMFQSAFDPIKDAHGVITIADANNVTIDQLETNFVVSLVTSPKPNAWNTADAISAAYNFSQTYDYYQDRHGRNSIDGKGGNITAIVRVAQLDNAFWNGNLKMMFFGNVLPYADALDIVGHELTHGVTENTANLVYENQSGAMNEAFSDIFGEMVEARTTGHNDWLLGTKLPKVFRNMKDPGAITIAGLNRPYPSKMSQFIQLPNNENGDSGGVHINSSIINHAFYLLAEGLNGALGLRDAERIFYRCLTVHLQAQSQFIDARLGCIAAAEELFGPGSTQALKVAETFDAVEIMAAPSTPAPSPVPVVQGPDSTVFVYFDWFAFDYALGRRETTQGDGNLGVTLAGPVRKAKPSVLGDGSAAVFIDSNYDMGAVDTKTGEEARLGYPGLVHAVVASPDGRLYAFVLRNAFTGQPENKILVLDLVSKTNRTYSLVAPVIDSAPVDNVLYADSLTFTTDGKALIYDAVSQIRFANIGTVQRWSIYSLDLTTEKTTMVVPPLEGLDTGNPSIGRAGNRYLVFDAQNIQTTDTTIIVMDLFTGDVAAVGSVSKGIGYPSFTGDETAVIYAKDDLQALNTGFSLVKQTLVANRLGPSGQPTLWLGDSPVGVVYRRGAYVSSNALPQVTLGGPANGATFNPPATITLTASASDQDGQVAKVEFYQGATKLGESSAPPYQYSWKNVAAGNYRLIARAIDNLGGATDSAAVSVTVGNAASAAPTITSPPQSQTVNVGANVTFSVGANGTAPLAYQWLFQGSGLSQPNASTLNLTNVQLNQAGQYRVVVSNVSGSVTSAPAILTVNPGSGSNSILKILSAKLTGAKELELAFASTAGQTYQVESSTNLQTWSAIATTNAVSTTTSFLDTTARNFRQQFYRVRQGTGSPGTNQANISPQAQFPLSGQVYPGGTVIGTDILGLQYTIPTAWKGGLRAGSSTMIFGSDTEPGLVIGFLTLAGDGPSIAGAIGSSFATSAKGGFTVSQLPTATGNRITGEWTGYGDQQGAILRLEGVVHPSGGLIGFAGLFTAPNRGVMQQALSGLVGSTVMVPRKTDDQWVSLLKRKAFQWVSYKSTGNGGSSGSLSSWSQNSIFFCSGTYEVTKYSESTYGGSLSGGGFYTGGSSGNSTEAGDWTVLQTAGGPALLMLSSQGAQSAYIGASPSGNSFYFGDQEFSYTGPNQNCAGP